MGDLLSRPEQEREDPRSVYGARLLILLDFYSAGYSYAIRREAGFQRTLSSEGWM
jgi:hypothetical protein